MTIRLKTSYRLSARRMITGIMATGEVVGSILLAADELLRVEELAVGTSPHLIDHSGLQIDEDSTGHMLSSTSLAEEGVESIITSTDGLVTWHLAIGLKNIKFMQVSVRNLKPLTRHQRTMAHS